VTNEAQSFGCRHNSQTVRDASEAAGSAPALLRRAPSRECPTELRRRNQFGVVSAGFKRCATLLLSADVIPKIVRELLSHASIVLRLDTYIHVPSDMHQKASDKLERCSSVWSALEKEKAAG
jgi:hypothetical protein